MEVAVNRFLVSLFLLMFASPVTAMGIEYEINWLPPTESVDGSPLTDLAGFKIYWKTSQTAAYTQHVIVGDEYTKSHTLSLTIDGNTRLYIVMTAFDLEGNESIFSNEISTFFLESDSMAPGPAQINGASPRIVDCPTNMTCQIGPTTQ